MKIHIDDDFQSSRAIIKVIGVGGAGGNAVNRMANPALHDVDLIAANSDAQDLRRSLAPLRVQLGETVTQGLGVGGQPEIGRQAAEESMERLREVLHGAHLIFITAGMGGGTGTGGAPVVAKIAREMGALTVGVVTRPFDFEGLHRATLAESGIQEMRRHVDTLLIIPNQKLLAHMNPDATTEEAYRSADDVLRKAVQSISNVITNSGVINVDLNDIRAIMKDAGEALIGMGEDSGPGRALKAARAAIQSPLLENVAIDGARGLIVNISGSSASLKLSETDEIMGFITNNISPDAKIKMGKDYDEAMGEALRVTVIATGFPARRRQPLAGVTGRLRPAGTAAGRWGPEGGASSEGEGDLDWLKPAFLRIKSTRLK